MNHPEPAPIPAEWHDDADVVIVGFGGAGACAAIEAAESGAEVRVIDRFTGGGATAISGGVFYGGGGTAIQQEAGVEDSVEDMFRYLQLEVGDAVTPATLRRFCEGSVATAGWLQEHGVPFQASLCPVKTSYPSNDFYLYYSGNESFSPYKDAARPAARGHRAVGTGLPGANFYEPLRSAALAAGAVPIYQSKAQRLVVDGGRVLGVEIASIPAGFHAMRHRVLAWLAIKINPYQPRLAKRFRKRIARIERKHAVTRYVRARGGVVLAAGGFIYNREMVAEHAPDYRPGMPLGTTGCDGSGILLGCSAGGVTNKMDQVSAWRFINPPEAFVKGIFVDRNGERFANERLYGAQLGRAMVDEHRGEGLLIIDQNVWDEARAQCKGSTGIQWFQQAPALLNLYKNRKVGSTVEDLASKARIDAVGLRATVDQYNRIAAGDEADPFNKGSEFTAPISRGPFYAINCSLNSRGFPCPTLTLGGLVVDEDSGAVKDAGGVSIEGLYAAGRNAVGVCSNGYVSGLSLADCVFSGRRAGASAASVGALSVELEAAS